MFAVRKECIGALAGDPLLDLHVDEGVWVARLTTTHVDEFAAIKELCYRGLDSAALRERVGDRLARHLGAASYCFGATDPVTALPVHSISVGLDPAVMEVFYGLVLSTPSLDFGPWITRSDRVARLEELVDDVDTDPYMTEILRPSGLRHDVQMACVGGGWSWGHLCLRRASSAEAFTGHELRFLDAIAPHVTAGLRAAAGQAATVAAPGASSGIVVLGPDGKIELANGVAERLFRQPVSGTRHSLLTAVNIVAARLERVLSGEHDAPLPELSMTEEATGCIYRVRAEQVLGADGRARGLVMIEPEVARSDGQRLEALARFGLSRRECEVVVAVVRGGSNADTAAALCMSPHTVRDHLSKAFDKLGVRSRQELAFRLLGAA